jgi:hypothetical protein
VRDATDDGWQIEFDRKPRFSRYDGRESDSKSE